jgi:hypothetical protein
VDINRCGDTYPLHINSILIKGALMKKIIVLLIVTMFGTTSISTIVCPKGEHPYDGTGSHHKGGYFA